MSRRRRPPTDAIDVVDFDIKSKIFRSSFKFLLVRIKRTSFNATRKMRATTMKLASISSETSDAIEMQTTTKSVQLKPSAKYLTRSENPQCNAMQYNAMQCQQVYCGSGKEVGRKWEGSGRDFRSADVHAHSVVHWE